MATRRPTTTTAVTLPKPTLNLEEWETKAPLGELETRSVSLLRAVSERSTLPVKVCSSFIGTTADGLINIKFSVDEPGPSSRPASPSFRSNRLQGTPRPGTPVVGGSSLRSQTVASLEPKHSIQTPQQFYDWFALIDGSVTHSQEAHFRAHLANLANHLETCDRFAQLVDEIDQEVERMLNEWRSVEDSAKSLNDACEHMLEERVSDAAYSVSTSLNRTFIT